MSVEKVLAAVRKACLPALWSQGVKIARDRGVSRVAADASEITVRVRAPGQAIAPTVTLYVDGAEWSCDCDSKADPCAHVAAAAIACAQGDDAVEATSNPARLAYRFYVKDRRLALKRVLVQGDKETILGNALTSDVARGRADFSPTHEDILIDRILGSPAREHVPLGRIGDVFEALTSAEVTFEGERVKVHGEAIRPRATVEDAPGSAFRLRVDKDPRVSKVVAMGVARLGEVLAPLAQTETTGEWLEKLPLVRVFSPAQEAELVTVVLPELEKKVSVEVKTRRLARRSVEARPRIALDLSHAGHTLSVMPLLVYGEPAIARVDGAAIVSLGADKHVPLRRPGEERELLRALRDELNLVPGRRVNFDGADAARFATKLRAYQERHGITAEGSTKAKAPLVPRVLVDGLAFDVAFELPESEGTKGRANAATVMRAWQDGLDLVPLEGGGWAPLPSDWLEKHGHRVADLLAARGEDEALPRALLPELGELCESLDAPSPPALEMLSPLVRSEIPSAPLPEGLHADLRPYQRAGIDWLSFLRSASLGAVLADDMGLGKTLQTIAVLEGKTLVVCPRSVVHNWAAEIARFRPDRKVALYHGPRRALDHDADITLTTYAVLRLDTTLLSTRTWDVVVLDEAQAIKNESSQTARAAFALQAKMRIALSGTPVENRLEELWSVMHFANPGLLGGRSSFQERYALPIASGDPTAASRLRAKIRPFLLRRIKKDVLPELPPRTDSVLHIELEESERAVYDAVRVATQKDIATKLAAGGGVLAALEALLRLRQAACHPSLVPGQTAETSSKVEGLIDAIEEAAADGHKALVFSQWTSLLDLIEPHLKKAEIGFVRLDGSTRDRGGVVAKFQSTDGPPVMLVSLKAGGTGLNLTAADHVFLLDPWWNPAVEDQAADRAHRIGQDKPVMVYKMVAKDTVEERILVLQERKRALADVALGEAGQARGITKEELLALLD